MNNIAALRHRSTDCVRAIVDKIGDLIQRRFWEDASSFAVMREVDKRWPYLSFRVWLYSYSLTNVRVTTMRECVGGIR
jgi:hypothetical protein